MQADCNDCDNANDAGDEPEFTSHSKIFLSLSLTQRHGFYMDTPNAERAMLRVARTILAFEFSNLSAGVRLRSSHESEGIFPHRTFLLRASSGKMVEARPFSGKVRLESGFLALAYAAVKPLCHHFSARKRGEVLNQMGGEKDLIIVRRQWWSLVFFEKSRFHWSADHRERTRRCERDKIAQIVGRALIRKSQRALGGGAVEHGLDES
jgi:hypothetical protein